MEVITKNRFTIFCDELLSIRDQSDLRGIPLSGIPNTGGSRCGDCRHNVAEIKFSSINTWTKIERHIKSSLLAYFVKISVLRCNFNNVFINQCIPIIGAGPFPDVQVKDDLQY